ncbi:MAG: hypothetical protein H0X03_00090 [Nitrosopumilus sp.]|nr:hypothetical protein [Nitrosopumilus sp.]
MTKYEYFLLYICKTNENEEEEIYTGPSTDGLIQSNTGQYLMLDLTKNKKVIMELSIQ